MKVTHCHLDEGGCEERSGVSARERFLATALKMTGRTASRNDIAYRSTYLPIYRSTVLLPSSLLPY